MHTEYYKEYSPALGREMELKVYGHGGQPVLFIPCQNGRFFDFENFGLTGSFGPYIDSGRVSVYAIDTIDRETWSDTAGDPRSRILQHERWVRFVVDEIAPFMQARQREKGWQGPGPVAFGCSLGATHAANFFYRFPDCFWGLLALSGIYTASYGFGDYRDEEVFLNSPVDYLGDMPPHHPYIEKYNQGRSVVCVGTGPWEEPATTIRLKEICLEKGIDTWVDIWGPDVAHDWPWWYRQLDYFLPKLLY